MFAIACHHRKGFLELFSLASFPDGSADEILSFSAKHYIIFNDLDLADRLCNFLNDVFEPECFIVVEL